MSAVEPLLHYKVVSALVFGVHRLDIEDLRQTQKIKAFVLLLMHDSEHLMSDMYDLLEELVA